MTFKGTMMKAMNTVALPAWQNKQPVPRNAEGKLVIHRETRDLFKEMARRNNTNMATVIWLAGFNFWLAMGYSRAEYDKIMGNKGLSDSLKDKVEGIEKVRLQGRYRD